MHFFNRLLMRLIARGPVPRRFTVRATGLSALGLSWWYLDRVVLPQCFITFDLVRAMLTLA